jgi:hypothetical protein
MKFFEQNEHFQHELQRNFLTNRKTKNKFVEEVTVFQRREVGIFEEDDFIP